MKITILSKNYGTQTIDTDNYCPAFAAASSTAYKVIEHIFNEWYDDMNERSSDVQELYYGYHDEPAPYSRKGAIRQGIEVLIDTLLETGKAAVVVNTRQIAAMDIECAFE